MLPPWAALAGEVNADKHLVHGTGRAKSLAPTTPNQGAVMDKELGTRIYVLFIALLIAEMARDQR